MSPQGYDEVVNAVGGVVSSEDDRLVLPVVLFCASKRTMFADLSELKTTEWFLFPK